MFLFNINFHPVPGKSFQETDITPLIRYPDPINPQWTVAYHVTKLVCGNMMFWFHLDVPHMTHSALKEMWSQWPTVRKNLPDIIFTAAHQGDSPGLNRFRERSGWHHITTMHCDDGVTRRFYAHVLAPELLNSPIVNHLWTYGIR
jgi:hypothetical protein